MADNILDNNPAEEEKSDSVDSTQNPDEKPLEILKMEARNKTGVLLDQLEIEMRQGYRDIHVKDFGKVRIYLPNAKTEREISDTKIKLVSELLSNEEIITKEQIMDKLRARNLWDSKKDGLEQNFTTDIIDLTRDIMYEQHQENIDYKKLAELRIRKNELEKKRKDLTETRDYFLSASLEIKVEVALFKQQMVLCVHQVNDDNTEAIIWNSVDELENDTRKYMINRISTSAGYFWNGWSEDLLFEALDA